MKRFLLINGLTLALVFVLLPLLGLFVYVALRSGPLAPVPVTVTTVESAPISPALFGIGTVEARYTYRIGPTFAGRLLRLDAQVGDWVVADQVLGEMDPVDLDERIKAQKAALKHAESNVQSSLAQMRDISARKTFADTQARRYQQLFTEHAISAELAETKLQEKQVLEASLEAARANLDAARQEPARLHAEVEGLVQQRVHLQLVAPHEGLVSMRLVDPGTTVVAGQAAVEIIDPKSLWLNVRFDQISATGLAAGLPATIVLRSRSSQNLTGHVLRLEPLADAVTEETLAKVVFDSPPDPLPPVGELVEVTIALPALAEAPVIPNAAVQRLDGQIGVWRIENGDLHFNPVKLGIGDLDGHVQVSEGLNPGDRIVVYSAKALTLRSRIKVVEQLAGSAR